MSYADQGSRFDAPTEARYTLNLQVALLYTEAGKPRCGNVGISTPERQYAPRIWPCKEVAMLPTIRIELRHAESGAFKSTIIGPDEQVLGGNSFRLGRGDVFLSVGQRYLAEDFSRADHAVDVGFIPRLGEHFYQVITGGESDLELQLRHPDLEQGFNLVWVLDPYREEATSDAVGAPQTDDVSVAPETESHRPGIIESLIGFESRQMEPQPLWQVPWEYVRHSLGFMVLDDRARVWRTLLGLAPQAAEESPLPLRVLVVVASPVGQPELDAEGEVLIIQKALDPARRQGLVDLDYLELAGVRELRQRVQDYQPHVIHYAGHGGRLTGTGQTYLALEDENGNLRPMLGAKLSDIVAASGSVKLVVLSGCATAQTSDTDAFKGVATALLRGSAPAVVAMQYSILDSTGLIFDRCFYESIGQGSTLAEAVGVARQELSRARGPNRADWGIPVLYLCGSDMRLVDRDLSHASLRPSAQTVGVSELPQVVRFVGRKKEYRLLRRAIADEEVRAAYVWGLGGIGKTALASKLLRRVQGDGRTDDVAVIRCDHIDPSFAGILESIAQFIESRGRPGHHESAGILRNQDMPLTKRLNSITEQLGERRYVFLFDNFESLFETNGAIGTVRDKELNEFLSSWLTMNWRSVNMFTCRLMWDLLQPGEPSGQLRCGLRGQQTCELHLEGLDRAQSRILMEKLPHLSQLDFSQQEYVLSIAQGHPHTLQFLDGYLRQHDLDAIATDYQLRKLVSTGAVDAVGDYFLSELWGGLPSSHQEVLALVSVFRVPLRAEDVQALLPDRRIVEDLRGYSLLQSEGEDRIAAHPVVSQFALGRCSNSVRRQLHLQAIEHYLEVYRRHIASDRDPSRDALQGLLIDFAVGQRYSSGARTGVLAGFLNEIHYHLLEAGHSGAAANIARRLWPYFKARGQKDMADRLLRLTEEHTPDERITEATAGGDYADDLRDVGYGPRALAVYEQRAAKFAESSGPMDVASHKTQKAYMCREQGHYEAALELHKEALDEFGIYSDGQTANYLGIVRNLRVLGRRYDAKQMAEEALEHVPDYDRRNKAELLYEVGVLLEELGQAGNALDPLIESHKIMNQLRIPGGTVDTATALGRIMLPIGSYDQGLALLEEALEMSRRLRDPVRLARACEAVGEAFEIQEHWREAREKYAEAREIMKEHGSEADKDRLEQRLIRVEARLAGR